MFALLEKTFEKRFVQFIFLDLVNVKHLAPMSNVQSNHTPYSAYPRFTVFPRLRSTFARIRLALRD